MNITTLYNYFRQSPESTWIMQYPNAVDLYDFIIKNPIKKILNLGTGIGFSDAVIALAWKDKGVIDGEIDSIEQYEKCVKIANELIPEEFKKCINIHRVDAIATIIDQIPYQYFSVYEKLPDKEYDLIINDGPGPFVDVNGNFLELPNGTIHKLTLENKIKPGTFIIYDGRINSLNYIERFLCDCYYIIKVPTKGSDFFVLQRKDNEVIIRDDRKEAFIKKTIYFENHEKSETSNKENSFSSNK